MAGCVNAVRAIVCFKLPAREASRFCDFLNWTFAISSHLSPLLLTCLSRITLPNLCQNINHFDAVDVILQKWCLFWRTVYFWTISCITYIYDAMLIEEYTMQRCKRSIMSYVTRKYIIGSSRLRRSYPWTQWRIQGAQQAPRLHICCWCTFFRFAHLLASCLHICWHLHICWRYSPPKIGSTMILYNPFCIRMLKISTQIALESINPL